MDKKILDHYLEYSQFTYPGLYESYLKELPDDIEKLGLLIRKQLIHRTTLDAGNTGSNADLKYGDMTKVPWFRQDEDDNFPTAAAIIAELFRRDPKGFHLERKTEDKLVLTCRYTAILMASCLKAKGVPTRVRSGYAPYFPMEEGSSDHWINEYWDENKDRWVIIDVDGSLHNTGFDMYDLPESAFDYPAVAWLKIREGKVKGDYFKNAAPAQGMKVVGWALFYDFHCLMNNEIIYLHNPKYLHFNDWDNADEESLKELDEFAKLLQKPDENFVELVKIWNTNKKFRILKGGLL